MRWIRSSMALLVFSIFAACSGPPEVSMKGHQLRLFAVDQPAVAWITQDDVKSAVIATSNGDKTVMQVSLKPDAEQRMLALTAANVGKTIRYTWDEKVVTDMKVMTSFGGTFQLPMPPS